MPGRPFQKRDQLVISTLGLEFAVAVVCGAAAGYFADRHFNATPWLTVAGAFLGFALGLYILIKTAVQLTKNEPKKK